MATTIPDQITVTGRDARRRALEMEGAAGQDTQSGETFRGTSQQSKDLMNYNRSNQQWDTFKANTPKEQMLANRNNQQWDTFKANTGARAAALAGRGTGMTNVFAANMPNTSGATVDRSQFTNTFKAKTPATSGATVDRSQFSNTFRATMPSAGKDINRGDYQTLFRANTPGTTTGDTTQPTVQPTPADRSGETVNEMTGILGDIARGESVVFDKLAKTAFNQLDPRLQTQMTITAMNLAMDPNMSEGAKRTAMAQALRDAGIQQSNLAASMATNAMNMATQAASSTANIAQRVKEFETVHRWDQYDKLMSANDFDGAAREFTKLTGRPMDATRLKQAWNQGYDLAERGMSLQEQAFRVGTEQWNKQFKLELDKFDEGTDQWWATFNEGKRQWTSTFDEGVRQFNYGKMENAMNAALSAGDTAGYADMFEKTYGYKLDAGIIENSKNRSLLIEGMDDLSALLVENPALTLDDVGVRSALNKLWEAEGKTGQMDDTWATDTLIRHRMARDPFYRALNSVTEEGATAFFGKDIIDSAGGWNKFNQELAKASITGGFEIKPDGTMWADLDNPTIKSLFGGTLPDFDTLPNFQNKETGYVEEYQGSYYKLGDDGKWNEISEGDSIGNVVMVGDEQQNVTQDSNSLTGYTAENGMPVKKDADNNWTVYDYSKYKTAVGESGLDTKWMVFYADKGDAGARNDLYNKMKNSNDYTALSGRRKGDALYDGAAAKLTKISLSGDEINAYDNTPLNQWVNNNGNIYKVTKKERAWDWGTTGYGRFHIIEFMRPDGTYFHTNLETGEVFEGKRK